MHFVGPSLATLAVLLLTGCLGSSGAQMDAVIEELAGTALVAPWVRTSDRETLGTATGPGAATLTTTSQEGDLQDIEVGTAGGAISLSIADGAIVQSSGHVQSIESASGDAMVLIVAATDGVFEHSSFGAWIDGLTSGQGSAGAGSFGTPTAKNRVPIGTTAAYNGASTGFAEVDGELSLAVATVRLVTDFETVVFLADNTRTVAIGSLAETRAPDLDLSGVLLVDGGVFAGSVASDRSSGMVTGNFFGPGAEEAGGLFQTSGQGVEYFGAFGAVR